MRKRSIVMCFLVSLMILLIGCGKTENEQSTNAEGKAEGITENTDESKPHEHEYTYQSAEDGYHD